MYLKIIKYTFCTLVIITTTLYTIESTVSPNYQECDRSISTHSLVTGSHGLYTTNTNRKCNSFYLMKLRSYLFNDNKASFYMYKMSTVFHSDKYYWLYISAIQGNKKAQKIIMQGSHIDWTNH